MRRCGDCQLCCKLLPVRELNKGAHERCQHQRVAKGCMVYDRAGMPGSCKLWNCRWLVDPEETAELSRPDRAHYVIDAIPDFVVAQPEDGPSVNIPVVQVWIDPSFPDSHRDPALRRYLDRLGEEGVAALIRFNANDAFTLFPPSMTGRGWVENEGGRSLGREHTASEVYDAHEAAGVQVVLKVRL